MRNTEEYLKENINVGMDYVTDELFLSYIFEVFTKIFINTSNVTFDYYIPSFDEYIKHETKLNPNEKADILKRITDAKVDFVKLLNNFNFEIPKRDIKHTHK